MKYPQPNQRPVKFLSRLLSVTAIAYANGQCVAVRGKVERHQLEAIEDCLADAGVKRGEIWIAGDGRGTFSREIGPMMHQRLRNILHT